MLEGLCPCRGILKPLLLRTRQVALSASEAELDDKNKRVAALEHEVAAAETALLQQRKEMQAEILKRDTEIMTLETELARLRGAVAQQSQELEAAGEEMSRLRIASDQARSARECMHVSRCTKRCRATGV